MAEPDTEEKPKVEATPQADPPKRTPIGLDEARRWGGFRLDDISGETVAKVESIYVDAGTGEPRWLQVKLGFFGKHCLVPVADAVGGAGRVWLPYEREWIRQAPDARPGKPLDQQAELALCTYWGFAAANRAREIEGREANAMTARQTK